VDLSRNISLSSGQLAALLKILAENCPNLKSIKLKGYKDFSMIQNEKILLIGKVLSSVNMLDNQKLRLIDIKNNNISPNALI
jgi:hypothetical protein